MPNHQKKTQPDWWTLRPRRCKYCRAMFSPNRPQDKDAKFCEPNHRKAYHRYGGLPFDKLMERVRKELKIIKSELHAEIERVTREKIRAEVEAAIASYVSSQAPRA